MRKLFLLLLAPAALLLVAAPAAAFPAGVAPKITCDTLSIDPVSWLKVTFTGTINGVKYSRTVFYAGEHPHEALAHISDLTTATGPLTITSVATGPYLGTSKSATVTLTCHQPPPTSTTSVSTTSTTMRPTTTTIAPTPPTTPQKQLPRTGSRDGQYAVLGGMCVLFGAGVLLGASKRRA